MKTFEISFYEHNKPHYGEKWIESKLLEEGFNITRDVNVLTDFMKCKYVYTQDDQEVKSMITKKIDIYDKGELVGIVEVEFKEGPLMGIYQIYFSDEQSVEVLHVVDMDYGIVITTEMANRIREAL